MTAKAKKFIAAGYAGAGFRLGDAERTRLQHHGLTDDDLHWLERQLTMFNRAIDRTDAAPTPAQVRAALNDGEIYVQALQSWLHDLDDLSRGLIQDAAFASGIPWDSFHETDNKLRNLEYLIELARRQSDEPKRGRLAQTTKVRLAEQVMARFRDEALAYEVLRAVLPDGKRSLKSAIAEACKELAGK